MSAEWTDAVKRAAARFESVLGPEGGKRIDSWSLNLDGIDDIVRREAVRLVFNGQHMAAVALCTWAVANTQEHPSQSKKRPREEKADNLERDIDELLGEIDWDPDEAMLDLEPPPTRPKFPSLRTATKRNPLHIRVASPVNFAANADITLWKKPDSSFVYYECTIGNDTIGTKRAKIQTEQSIGSLIEYIDFVKPIGRVRATDILVPSVDDESPNPLNLPELDL